MSHSIQQLKQQQLPTEFLNTPVQAEGIIYSIPAIKNQQTSFVFKITRLTAHNIIQTQARQVRLSWYFAPATVQVGDAWQLMLRLKNPPINKVPGSFDYAQWLLSQHSVATGYVQSNSSNHLILRHYPIKLIDSLRAAIATNIQTSLRTTPCSGLIQALVVGVRSNISNAQWDVMRGTGTNHLFAIAGLHIGFVSALIYGLVSFCWRRLGTMPLRCPTPIVAAVGALSSAFIYSALAGFSLPTQRAMIMTAAYLLSTLARKKIPLWHCWSLALVLILLNEPFAVLSASFWMSFSAVALIIYGVSGRLYHPNKLRHWLYPQWVIAVGLIPVSLLFFETCSLLNFVANAIAIPWIGLIVLPLSLLGGILSLLWPLASNYVLLSAAKMLELFWPLLVKLSEFSNLQWQQSITQIDVLITAVISISLLLAPNGMPARWLGILWALPLLLNKPAQPPAGAVWLSIFSLKSGMAVIVQTHTQNLLYESAINSFFNTNSVLPYLHYLGVHQLTGFILNTNSANQQAAFALLDEMPVQQMFINHYPPRVQGQVFNCTLLQKWQHDGVDFTIMNAAPASDEAPHCELILTLGNKTILIVDSTQLPKVWAPLPAINTLITNYKTNKTHALYFINTVNPAQLILTNGGITASLASTTLGKPRQVIVSEEGNVESLHFTKTE